MPPKGDFSPNLGFNQIAVHNDTAIKYMPNADFQLWFRPVITRLALCVAAAPFVVMGLGVTKLLTPILEIALSYLRLFKDFLISPANASMAVWIDWLSSVSVPTFFILGLALAYFTIKFAMQPDIIYVSPSGLVFGKQFFKDSENEYTTINVQYRINWEDISKIEIIRPPKTRSNRDYCFELQRWVDPFVKIRYGDIVAPEDRKAFLHILKNRFGQWLDDEALSTFDPPTERQSYTELWLAELSAPPKRDRLTPLEIGAKVFDQKYQIIAKLGVGGQGTVYLALGAGKKEVQEKEVVLKEFVLPVFQDKSVRKAAAVRFQEEANLLTKLDHPQIVKLKEIFLEDHRAYLVLEHLTGKNLKDLVAEQGPLPPKEILRLAKQMCEILTYLHSQQPPVVHRDFTPDNLMLDEDCLVKLIDFSVAQSFTSNVTGSVVGKPHYIAPEQFRGKPTCQSDIYSMGASLFYLATGLDPEPITTLRLKEFNTDSGAGSGAGSDAGLASIIEKCTKLDVANRYQNAPDVLKDVLKQLS